MQFATENIHNYCPRTHDGSLRAYTRRFGLRYPEIKFDSNSFRIRVDNHATACLTPSLEDLIGPVTPSQMTIKGITAGLSVKGRGTICWNIQNDTGQKYQIMINDALYIPQLDMQLLLLQHWSQDAKDNFPDKRGTWCGIFDDACEIYWDQRKFM